MTVNEQSGERPTIKTQEGSLHIVADEAELALRNNGAPFYVRSGLVRPIVDTTTASHGYKTKVPRIKDVSIDYMRDQMSRSAQFLRFHQSRQSWVPVDPPKDVASVILAREGEWHFPQLSGVITTPTLRPDGSILSSPGYDEQTQLLLLDPPELPAIPDAPTKDDALAALRLLDSLLDEFAFVDAPSRAVALSGFLSTVARGALLVVPMHAMKAPTAASGKSYGVDLWSAVATGDRAPVIAAGAGEDETDKRVAGELLKGQPIINIDNVNGKLGSDALCQIVERPVISLRILGTSRTVSVENRATVFCNGNNIQLVGDMTRRVVTCSLDTNHERPELRKFKRDPFQDILSDRGRYIAAALTVVRAYIVAGYPNLLNPLASFGDWSRLVRSPLVWLGYADPVETMSETRATDPTIVLLSRMLYSLEKAVGEKWLTTGEVIELAKSSDNQGKRIYPDLCEALLEIKNSSEGEISSRDLGIFLGRHKDRVIGSLKLLANFDAHKKQQKWCVRSVNVVADS
ncbi:hypothetical protein Q9K02_01745 [Qipengyuania sp. G39]|uniref:DNA primase n=1 Tax=Qipengyuania profundimaris TaxID=3067652 RepID=A0ABT9HLG4_9SPHN|nr:hypothetical protein [Qipengyuania sp. G39]MDP4573860.1 hypothetical protein [Qipengyuania sp. G39]